jgi:hypothetical protein
MPHLVALVLPDTDHFSMRDTLDDAGSSICRLIWDTMGAGKPTSGKA